MKTPLNGPKYRGDCSICGNGTGSGAQPWKTGSASAGQAYDTLDQRVTAKVPQSHHHQHQLPPSHTQAAHTHTHTHQPVPQDATCHNTDYIQTIMSSYVEQTNLAALRMSALLHAFVLCQQQLATVAHHRHLLDIWCKLVPSILQLTGQSKVVAETMKLHFLNILESSLEYNSTELNKLLPLRILIHHSPMFNVPRRHQYQLPPSHYSQGSLDATSTSTSCRRVPHTPTSRCRRMPRATSLITYRQ